MLFIYLLFIFFSKKNKNNFLMKINHFIILGSE